ncbi:MAG: hypothetical protein AB1430_07530 [Pseudomonadota bacterium]
MSGALKSVFGGNGGIFGAVLGVASMFFPPLAIAGSMSNLLTSAIGQAVKLAASTLVKEFAMPKFIEAIVNQVVDKAVKELTKDSDPAVDDHVRQQAGGEIDRFVNESAQEIVQRAMQKMRQQGLEDSDENRTKAKAGGKKSAGSWLEAIAQAMGEALGQKAAKMVELSDKIASTAGKEGKEAAAENAKATTEMQATSQMFNLMQSGFSNAIKSIGEGLTQMARKG